MADNDTTIAPTHISRDTVVKTHENIKGHTDSFTSDRDVTMSGEFDDRVMKLLNGVLEERENRENMRANKRNENRLFTLLGALVIGLVVTYVLTSGLLPHRWNFLVPYAFVITIVMDSSLAFYSYVKKY